MHGPSSAFPEVRMRWLVPIVALLATAGPAAAGDGTALPREPGDLVLVGDSVPAGVYFLYLSDRTAEQGWASQVLARYGLPVPSTRLPGPYPLDHLELTRHGQGFLGLRYLLDAAGALLGSHRPLFAKGEVRSIVAVPGQTVGNVLRQSSDNHRPGETGWIFAELFLPRHLTVIQTVEQDANRPKWIVLSIGANDLLSPFGIVGRASAPDPAGFERDYRELTTRLRATMDPASRAEQLLCVTLPDVTRLPFLQPVPAGARDASGSPLPAGTVASAFLVPYGRTRFEDDEVWTPAELQAVRDLARSYNDAVRRIATEGGFTVVDLGTLLDRVSADPSFDSPRSPYFSPDLHHPSERLHTGIADLVVSTMARAARASEPAAGDPPDPPLPTNADFDASERARARMFTRSALLGLERGDFPPRPTLRGAVEIGALAGGDRPGPWAIAVQGGLEIGPTPVLRGWVSRLALQARTGTVWSSGEDDFRALPRRDSDLRLGLALEPLGRWEWMRVEAGARIGLAGGPGWYARGEWRKLWAETFSDGVAPRYAQLGVRIGAAWLRPGHNGN